MKRKVPRRTPGTSAVDLEIPFPNPPAMPSVLRKDGSNRKTFTELLKDILSLLRHKVGYAYEINWKELATTCFKEPREHVSGRTEEN